MNELVLPQLWAGEYAMPIIEARQALLIFLGSFESEIEIVTDALQFNWELYCKLA